MFDRIRLKQKYAYKWFLQVLLLTVISGSITGCLTGEEELATTSFINLRIVGTDQSAVPYEGTTETNPSFSAIYNTSAINLPGMNLIFKDVSDKTDVNYDHYLRISFIPNGSTRNTVYDDTSSNVDAYFELGTKKYAVASSVYTPMTVTINSYGDVGETIDGSFDIILCDLNIVNYDRTACLDEGNFVQLIGTFGYIRGDDN